MAKRLTKYDREVEGPPLGRPPEYPWAEWLDGSTWELAQHKDFVVSLESMERMIRRTSENYELPISVYVNSEEKTIVIQPRKN